MIMKCPLLPVIFLFSVVLISSCSARVDGVVLDGGSAEVELSASLGPRTIALIRSVRGFMGETNEAPILDGPGISGSMSTAPGINSINLVNNSPSVIGGAISISNVGDFLALAGTESRLITYTNEANHSSIIIYLDMENAPLFVSMLSPEVEEYLMTLMVPFVVGERFTKDEYLALLTAVYGAPLADEIRGASIRALIQFPRPVRSVEGGAYTGRNAEFNISLLDLLVLEEPLRYEVRW